MKGERSGEFAGPGGAVNFNFKALLLVIKYCVLL